MDRKIQKKQKSSNFLDKSVDYQLSDRQQLKQSSWSKLALFCNQYYLNFTPQKHKNQKCQTSVTQIQLKCVEVIAKDTFENWEELINKNFSESEQKIANKFYYRLTYKYKESPAKIRQNLQANLKRFCELIEYAFVESENRDLVKISEFVDIINSFGNSSEQTFLFLSELPTVLNDDASKTLLTSIGYQTIVKWGASPYLRKFGLQLQRNFHLTRTAIKDEVAQNLVRDLGETETILRSQIERLLIENQELQACLKDIHVRASQTTTYQLAKTMQSQTQPVLDQVFALHQKLAKISETESNLTVTDREALSVLITLESLLYAFKKINITYFPQDISKVFELTSDRLGEYAYIEGSAFSNKEDKKIVRCVSPGWKVGEEIVTPARVKEVSSI